MYVELTIDWVSIPLPKDLCDQSIIYTTQYKLTSVILHVNRNFYDLNF